MVIGIVKEIKTNEFRVSVTPSGVHELHADGHTVLVQSKAGEGSGFSDYEYKKNGATIIEDVSELFNRSDMIVKVKEPLESEFKFFKEGQLLFTYLHLAAAKTLTDFLLEKKITAFSYETLDTGGHLPLLEPMSEIAGKMAALEGANFLGKYLGGKGKLMANAVGTQRTKVIVLGGGMAGKSAAVTAASMGAEVKILDINISRLRYLDEILPANVTTLYSTKEALLSLLPTADVIIGTVLIPGEKAPKMITKEMLKLMEAGTVLVDVSIDQGGCFETSRPTTHEAPVYIEDSIVHYCVANMPGAYPQTSSIALSNATLPYIRKLSVAGESILSKRDHAFVTALNTYKGKLTNLAVANSFNMEYTDLEDIL